MDDGQKQAINHTYHFLRDLLHKYEIGFFLCNGKTPSQDSLRNMIWYLETNFPEDMLGHEMGEDKAKEESPLSRERKKWEFRYNNMRDTIKENRKTIAELKKRTKELKDG